MMIDLEETLKNQENLEKLCADRELETNEIFSPNAYYGINYIIKEYAELPEDYPLKAIFPHGIRFGNTIWETEMNSVLPVIFAYSREYQQILIKAAKDYHRYNLIGLSASPFLYVVELLKNQPKPKRKGTIFFPAHSTHHITAKMDFEALAKQLDGLDEEYKPITVCIYWKDFYLGHHVPFENRGMRIVSAGHIFDRLFLLRLYHLCSQHIYAASNAFGSHLFYSIKAGCSFFYMDIDYYNLSSSDARKKEVSVMDIQTKYRFVSLFKERNPRITSQQLQLVDNYSGTKYMKSRQNLKSQLWQTELLFNLSKLNLINLKSKLKVATKKFSHITYKYK